MQGNTRRPRVRSVLAMLLVVTALAAAVAVQVSPAAAGSAGWRHAPEVESRSLALSARLPVAQVATAPATDVVTLNPGIPFTMLGLTCAVPQAEGGVLVRLRTSADGVSWSRWYEVPLELVNDGQGRRQACTEALWTGPGRLVQVCAGAAGGEAPVALSDVRLVALDTEPPADPLQQAGAALRRVAAALGALDGTDSALAAVTQPQIVTRAKWGADESLRTDKPTLAPVKMAFIHHTAGGNTYTQEQAPGIVRGVYEYHTQSLDWSDIGYNFLVDRFGTIYEGRSGGVSEGPIGAQTYGFNTGSTGISVIGDYMNAAPPAAALAALETLLAWKFALHGIDPQSTVSMTCGGTDKYKAGETVKFPAIAAHRDANYTDCPGDAFYARMPAIRAAVAAAASVTPPPATPAKWVVTLSLAPPQFAVNGRVAMQGTVTTASGAPGAGTITLQKSPVGGEWTTWRTATLAADGSYATSVRMTIPQVSQVRARMAGNGSNLTGYSVSRKVTVGAAAAEPPSEPPVSVALTKWVVALSLEPSRLSRNSRVKIRGTVKTAAGAPGAGTVTLQKRPVGGEWTTWRTVTLRADGSYATSVRMTIAQVAQVRARMAANAVGLAGYSALRKVTVLR